jgi:hypothetical protein
MTLIRLFLPLVATVFFNLHPVGTVFEYSSPHYHYTVTMTTSIVLDVELPAVPNQALFTSYSVTNLGEMPLHIGAINFTAFDKDTGTQLTYQPCLDELDERLLQNQTGTGSLCWIGEIGSEGAAVLYHHSIIERRLFGWEVPR